MSRIPISNDEHVPPLPSFAAWPAPLAWREPARAGAAARERALNAQQNAMAFDEARLALDTHWRRQRRLALSRAGRSGE